MSKDNQKESVQVLQVKLRVVTTLIILLLIWQVIDFLRVSSAQNSIDYLRGTIPSKYEVEQNGDDIKDMRRDISSIKNDMWDKAEKSTVKNQIDDVYDYVREYCRNW